MSRVEAFRKTSLRSLLKGFRTDMAMAVDDPFPFLYGLVDNNIITDVQLKDSLEKQAGEGIHKAMYSTVSWVLEQSRATVEDFWKCLNKDYNLDSYPRLRTLLDNLKLSKKWMKTATSGQNKRKKRSRENQKGTTTAQYSHYHSKATDKPVGKDSLSGSASKSETASAAFNHKREPFSSMGHCNDDECAVCRDGGELICCDGCPRAFHLNCVSPPLTTIPSGTWQCDLCCGEIVKKEEPPQLIQPHTLQPLQTTSYLPPLSSFSPTPTNFIPKEPNQEAIREKCGVCHLSGGDLTLCLQCLKRYHGHCHFTKGRSVCSSCSRSWVGCSGEGEAQCLQFTPAAQSAQSHNQTSAEPDGVLHNIEMDSILTDASFDGMLQWAFHSISRPLPDSRGCFQ
ncbi:autoimmune regulator [Eucyclogobius newberryi]|uniref:autoimmune regulator n=1 Tax=Eucyclogobius newberryi TaxID=166745 RepID=UPI003B5AA116